MTACKFKRGDRVILDFGEKREAEVLRSYLDFGGHWIVVCKTETSVTPETAPEECLILLRPISSSEKP
jgi:hypothetical protein